jgi:acyl-CoA dehydrogenase
MDFQLTDEQRMIAESARKLGEHFGLAYWREKDEQKAFPKELWKAIGEAGFCGVALPEEVGGSGRGMLESALVIENLAAAGGGSTLAQLFMITPIFGGVSISKFGTPRMKAEVLPGIVTGEIVCSMALTEPDAGTNTLETKTFAERDGDCWRLSGTKIWITGVEEAAKMLVIARTTRPEPGMPRTHGISMFMIDVQREGLTHQPIPKLGTNTLSSSSVFFDRVRIEPHELIGTLDKGWRELLDVLNTERVVTTAGLVGTSELALRLAVDYAKERRVFGSTPIGAYQGLQFPLAQCHAENEAARLLNYKAAANFDAGLPYGSEANAAKLLAAQCASKATEHAMQTMGGMGFAKEMHVERLWRDCRLFRFAPISEEMILNFIAQHDLGLPRSY